jgi:hypothetical protein
VVWQTSEVEGLVFLFVFLNSVHRHSAPRSTLFLIRIRKY